MMKISQKQIYILISLLVMCFPNFVFSKTKKVQAKKEVTLDKSLIHKELLKVLPLKLCDKNKKLMKCHKLSQEKCEKEVSENLKLCIKAAKSKSKLNAMESIRYSEQQGLCVRDKMKPRLSRIKRKCDDVTKKKK